MKYLIFFVFLFLVSCTPSRIVNVSSRHNYYNRHRAETFTRPMWIPGHGIVLYTEIAPNYRFYQPRYAQPQIRVRRGRH
jgi:hypothetical protein